MPTADYYYRNLGLMLLCALVVVVIIHISPVVYLGPMFVLSASLVGGMLEPRKGWQLALIQIVVIVGAYWLNNILKIYPPKNEEAAFFAAHTSILATLSASFLGGMIRKM